MSNNNKKILVHSCCAPCSTSVFEKLDQEGFDIEGFFFNPNIFPEDEYKRRLDEFVAFSHYKKIKANVSENFDRWNQLIKGLDSEPEGGKRCKTCFLFRLEETAKFALKNDFDSFTTVLTVSPYKNSALINKIGKILEQKYNICFYAADFKKNNGFKRSLELSKQYGLYRQKYCGCKFSIRVS